MGIFSTRNAVAFAFALFLAAYQVSRQWSAVMGQGSLKKEEFAHTMNVLTRVLDKTRYRYLVTTSSFDKEPNGILILAKETTPSAVAAELTLTPKMRNPRYTSSKRDRKRGSQRHRRHVAGSSAKPAEKKKPKVIGSGSSKKRPAVLDSHKAPLGKSNAKSAGTKRDNAKSKFFFSLQVYDDELEPLRDILLDENVLSFTRGSAKRSGGTPFSSLPPRPRPRPQAAGTGGSSKSGASSSDQDVDILGAEMTGDDYDDEDKEEDLEPESESPSPPTGLFAAELAKEREKKEARERERERRRLLDIEAHAAARAAARDGAALKAEVEGKAQQAQAQVQGGETTLNNNAVDTMDRERERERERKQREDLEAHQQAIQDAAARRQDL